MNKNKIEFEENKKLEDRIRSNNQNKNSNLQIERIPLVSNESMLRFETLQTISIVREQSNMKFF